MHCVLWRHGGFVSDMLEYKNSFPFLFLSFFLLSSSSSFLFLFLFFLFQVGARKYEKFTQQLDPLGSLLAEQVLLGCKQIELWQSAFSSQLRPLAFLSAAQTPSLRQIPLLQRLLLSESGHRSPFGMMSVQKYSKPILTLSPLGQQINCRVPVLG
jgi:hypothetical protein